MIVNPDLVQSMIKPKSSETWGDLVFDRYTQYQDEVLKTELMTLASYDDEHIDLMDYDSGGRYRMKEVVSMMKSINKVPSKLMNSIVHNLHHI